MINEIIEKAFRRARENAKSIKNINNKVILAKRRELVRIETVKNIVISEIDKLIVKIPKEKALQNFYKELLDITFGWRNIKRSIVRLKFIKQFILDLYEKYKNSIKVTRDIQKMKELRKEFYGRVASFLKRNKDHFEFLYEVLKKYKRFPKFKPYPTVVIAGLPNVGKSTLLKKLTGSEPEIQPYPFTTKDIMLGYIRTPYFNIQVVDTPGMLDRPFDQMNTIERKAILAIKHLANLIVYVIDLTETCGFSINEQVGLLKQIEKEFDIPIWIYFSKTDLFREEHWKKLKEIIKKIQKKYFENYRELKEELIKHIKEKKELYI